MLKLVNKKGDLMGWLSFNNVINRQHKDIDYFRFDCYFVFTTQKRN